MQGLVPYDPGIVAFVGGIAEHLEPTRIDDGRRFPQVHVPRTHVAALEGQFQALTAEPDGFLRLLALGNVVEGADEAALVQRNVPHLDDPAVGLRPFDREELAAQGIGDHFAVDFLGEPLAFAPVAHHVVIVGRRFEPVFGKGEHLGETGVVGDHAHVPVDHHDPLVDVAEGAIDDFLLPRQFRLFLLQVGDVDDDDHRSALRGRIGLHVDPSAVGVLPLVGQGRSASVKLPNIFLRLRNVDVSEIPPLATEAAHIGGGFTDPLAIRGQRGDLLETVVDDGNVHIPVDQQHAARHVVHGDAQLGFLGRQRLFRLLALGDVADDAGEYPFLAQYRLADRKVHGELGAVLAKADNLAAGPDDPGIAVVHVTLQEAVVSAFHGFGHENADVASDHLVGGIAENPFGRRAEALNHALLADDDDTVGGVFDDGADTLFGFGELDGAVQDPLLEVDVGLLQISRQFGAAIQRPAHLPRIEKPDQGEEGEHAQHAVLNDRGEPTRLPGLILAFLNHFAKSAGKGGPVDPLLPLECRFRHQFERVFPVLFVDERDGLGFRVLDLALDIDQFVQGLANPFVFDKPRVLVEQRVLGVLEVLVIEKKSIRFEAGRQAHGTRRTAVGVEDSFCVDGQGAEALGIPFHFPVEVEKAAETDEQHDRQADQTRSTAQKPREAVKPSETFPPPFP